MLGYKPIVASGSYYHRLDEVLSPGCQAINLEIWNAETVKHPLVSNGTLFEEFGGDIIESKLGAVGQESLYVPAYTTFVAGHYQGLAQNLPTLDDTGAVQYPLDLFPVDGTTGPEQLAALGMARPEFACTTQGQEQLGWSKSTCTEGRWCATPVCHIPDAISSPFLKE